MMKRFLAAALVLATLPAPALAQWASPQIESALRSADGGTRETRAFYAARGYRPIWIQGDRLSPAAHGLLELIETAEADGLDPDEYRPRRLREAIEKAERGSPKALARAEMLLSRTFGDYVRHVAYPRETGMVYVDAGLAPKAPTVRAALEAAAAATSLQQYVSTIGWMNPVYGPLRKALADYYTRRSPLGPQQEALLRLNRDRARALPAKPTGRYVLVDAASGRLWMYEDGRVRDSMKVVVGKSTEQTPMMAGLMRFAMVNPYWNLPPDLARTRAAQPVLKHGVGYLKTKGFQVTSDWSDNAKVLDPKKVDWKAAAAGQIELPVRQLPGKDNPMGRMKFMFPNELGIYLHDTPEKELFKKADRRFSSGCVRVEDAPRLAKWLFGKPLTITTKAAEQRVDLPEPVPVYITYLTAAPEAGRIAFRPDVYNRDRSQMAQLERGSNGDR